MGEPYFEHRRNFQSVSGSLNVLTSTDDTTLVAGKTNYVIYLQKLHIEVTTTSAKTWSFTDTAGSPISLVPSIDVSSIAHFDFDFGAKGVPLTVDKGFALDVSAAGAGGWIIWEGYSKLTTVAAA